MPGVMLGQGFGLVIWRGRRFQDFPRCLDRLTGSACLHATCNGPILDGEVSASPDLTCRVCGRTPAEEVTFRRVAGYLIVARMWTIEAVLCREHAERIGRSFTARSAIQGWWSVISLFPWNPAVILLNWLQLRRLRLMEPPAGEARQVDHPESPELQRALQEAIAAAPVAPAPPAPADPR